MIRHLRGARLLGLLLAFLFVVAACGDDSGDDSSSSDTTGGGSAAAGDCATADSSIWVLLPDSASSDRWETQDRPAFEAAFDEAGVDYTIVNAEGDAQQQQSQADQAIAEGAGVILLTNLDSGSGATIIDTARAAGVATVDYDRETVEGDGADVYVSFDNVVVGQTMAEVLEPAIDDLGLDHPPNVVMLNGGPTDDNARLFKEGYNETVSARVEAGDWNLVADEDVPDWDNDEAGSDHGADPHRRQQRGRRRVRGQRRPRRGGHHGHAERGSGHHPDPGQRPGRHRSGHPAHPLG